MLHSSPNPIFARMNTTKRKIIQTAIDLFNQRGVGNVRVRDIADAATVSPGNLTYHFKTKKDIIDSVHRYMLKNLEGIGGEFLKSSNVIIMTRDYLKFQIRFRFFYRDILEITHLFPEIKQSYKEQMFKLIRFNRKVLHIGVNMGYLVQEPHEGLYDAMARNSWAVQNSWLLVREILGTNIINVIGGIHAMMDFYFPYLTEKGKKFYYKSKNELEEWVEEGGLHAIN